MGNSSEDQTSMFALFDPTGEGLPAPACLGRSIYQGAVVTVEAINGMLKVGLQADRGGCYVSAIDGRSRIAQRVACLKHHHAPLTREVAVEAGTRLWQ